MSIEANLNGRYVEKVIDNRKEIVRTGLIKSRSEVKAPIISDKEGIYQSGDKKLHDRIIDIISTTRDVLCISSFIIQDSDIFGEIVKCTDRGVRVYILTSAETQVSDSMEDDIPPDKKKEAGRKLINGLGTKALLKSGENLHSKFILSDPKLNPRAMVFTFNLTVRALNENLEVAVELSKSGAMELYRQFISGFWVVSKRILTSFSSKSGSLDAAKAHPEFVGSSGIPNDIKWTLNEQTLIKEELMNMISNAKTSISISSWTFDNSHPIAKELINKAKIGIDVTVFTRRHPANSGFMKELVENGGKVYCHDLLHGKSVIVDGIRGVIMTANVSRLGMDEGFETAVILNEKQIEVLKEIHKEWKIRAQFVSFMEVQLDKIKDNYVEISNILEEKKPPLDTKEIKKGEIKVSNLEDYFKANLKIDHIKSDREALFVKYTAVLIPPRLPKDAVKTKIEKKFGVYQANNKFYVCIKKEEELEEAKKIAKEFNARIVLEDN